MSETPRRTTRRLAAATAVLALLAEACAGAAPELDALLEVPPLPGRVAAPAASASCRT